MANSPADPRLFYAHHVFMCTNVRPEGHPRGCCMERSAAGGGVDKLRGYAREKARQLGIESIRWNAGGCLDRYESQEVIDEIIETHLKNGGRVQRLMLQPDQLPPKH